MFGKEEYREINANLNRQLEEKQVLIAVHRGTWGGNVAQNHHPSLPDFPGNGRGYFRM